ncbi:MAG: glycosyltransferase family 2 protein [Bacteroidota bacterium]|nr:glycosyltransferase family 2 protein [Bacteroidota bacterium]
MSNKAPKVSVITVVYNAVDLLEKTIVNILAQTYPYIEYIIIDGGSSDGSLDIIKKYSNRIDKWVSEPDKGLYDAMNKGLKAASGDWVWFINAGDLIYSEDTTTRMFDEFGTEGAIYYGDTMLVDNSYQEIGLRRLRPPEKLTWKSFQQGMLVCHQSILVSRDLADMYNLKYPHSADFDWVIKALKKTDKIINTNMILSAFLDGGQSKQTIKPSLRERFNSMRIHYGLFPSVIRHIPIAFRFFTFYFKNNRF